MERLTVRKTRRMLDEGLIREINHIHLEGTHEVNSVRDCERVIEKATRDLLQISPDYYKIGSYLNIKRGDYWDHHISVFYYEKLKGGVNENV
jgi:hypothetical protein